VIKPRFLKTPRRNGRFKRPECYNDVM